VVWQSYGPDNEIYVALFNIADDKQTVSVRLAELDLSNDQIESITDLWVGHTLADVQEVIESELRPHACQLLKIQCR